MALFVHLMIFMVGVFFVESIGKVECDCTSGNLY